MNRSTFGVEWSSGITGASLGWFIIYEVQRIELVLLQCDIEDIINFVTINHTSPSTVAVGVLV